MWVIPSERMKSHKEHRGPLSDEALAVIESQRRTKQGDYVFPGIKPGMPLSNMALLVLLRRMKRADLTVHGFRSRFRDWASERTGYQREVAEAALAHAIPDAAIYSISANGSWLIGRNSPTRLRPARKAMLCI